MSLNILIGREKECRLIKDLMDQRKSIIIFGEEGTGKTAVLEKMLGESNLRYCLYSKQSKTLKESLANLVLSGSKEDLRKKNILGLKKIFYALLDKNPEYIIFDHIAWIEPKYYALLIYLIERELPLIIVTQGWQKRNIGQLWKALYDFEKIEIANLEKAKADELISHYIMSFSLKIGCERDFKEDVFDISKGNPRVTRQLCLLAQDEKYGAKGYIDVKLMDLDRRINATIV